MPFLYEISTKCVPARNFPAHSNKGPISEVLSLMSERCRQFSHLYKCLTKGVKILRSVAKILDALASGPTEKVIVLTCKEFPAHLKKGPISEVLNLMSSESHVKTLETGFSSLHLPSLG